MDIRNFRVEDLSAYTGLYNAAEAQNPDFSTVTAEELRRRILEDPSYDPMGHFVAVDEGAFVAGGRGIVPRERADAEDRSAYFELHVLPARLGTEAETAVFARIVSYLRGRGVELLLTRVDTRYEAKERLLRRLGFARTEYENHGMERDPRGAEPPSLPAGYRMREARMPDELEALWRVYNCAFATRRNYVPMALESFRRLRHFLDPANHSGFFVAERPDGTIVGMVLSGIDKKYNAEHDVRRGGSFALAVVPEERRRGLGTALLLRSVRWIRDAGMDTAYLSVNVANPDALTIYERAGYRTVQVYQGYGLRLA